MEQNVRDDDGWLVEAGEYSNSASQERSRPISKSVDVDLDDAESLYVQIREGSSYMEQSCSARIPTHVLVALLTRAGYTIVKNKEG